MLPKTRTEKIGLAVLGGLIFLIVNFYGYQWLARQQASLNLHYLQLKADRADAQITLLQQDLFNRRAQWIKDHQPTLTEEGEAKADMLQAVLSGARNNKLDITEQSLNDTDHTSAGTRLNVTVKVKGPMEGLCRWLADLQKPESFFAVTALSLKADQDQKSMLCTLKIARYFKSGN